MAVQCRSDATIDPNSVGTLNFIGEFVKIHLEELL